MAIIVCQSPYGEALEYTYMNIPTWNCLQEAQTRGIQCLMCTLNIDEYFYLYSSQNASLSSNTQIGASRNEMGDYQLPSLGELCGCPTPLNAPVQFLTAAAA